MALEITPDLIVSLAKRLAKDTRTTTGAHTEWTGTPEARIKHNGRRFTPRQAAYIVRTGHAPASNLRRSCKNPACIEPAHITEPTLVRTPAPATHGTWHDRAACRGQDTELWFSIDADDREAAKAICNRCPVRLDCLDEALDEERGQSKEYRAGIRGGMNAEERILERRRRNEAAKRARRSTARAAA